MKEEDGFVGGKLVMKMQPLTLRQTFSYMRSQISTGSQLRNIDSGLDLFTVAKFERCLISATRNFPKNLAKRWWGGAGPSSLRRKLDLGISLFDSI